MSKIFKRTSLQKENNSRELKVNKNRKRKVIVNFRMSEEEKELLNYKITLSGLQKQTYMREIAINHKVNVYGTIKCFSELKNILEDIKTEIQKRKCICDISENKLFLIKHIIEMFDSIENKKDSNYGNSKSQ